MSISLLHFTFPPPSLITIWNKIFTELVCQRQLVCSKCILPHVQCTVTLYPTLGNVRSAPVRGISVLSCTLAIAIRYVRNVRLTVWLWKFHRNILWAHLIMNPMMLSYRSTQNKKSVWDWTQSFMLIQLSHTTMDKSSRQHPSSSQQSSKAWNWIWKSVLSPLQASKIHVFYYLQNLRWLGLCFREKLYFYYTVMMFNKYKCLFDHTFVKIGVLVLLLEHNILMEKLR